MKNKRDFCGTLSEKDIGKEVLLFGWAHRVRDHGGLIFVDLRDESGIVQVVFYSDEKELLEDAREIRSEYVLKILGEVLKRPTGTENPELPTGNIEVKVKELEILNRSKTLPFQIEGKSDVQEPTRLKYRYLDLRRKEQRNAILFRSKVSKFIRDFLYEKGFLEIETPFLTKSTPEGARDFLVPSRLNPGTFYALPQSPQLFKQILMVSGFEKYFQIVRCFRDEDLRADRQPEFTQLDIEAAFVDEDDIIGLCEELMKALFREFCSIDLQTPFKRLTYKEAMDRYGTDKPDLRFGMELFEISDIVKDSEFRVFKDAISKGGIVKCLKVSYNLSRQKLDSLQDFARSLGAKGLAWARVDTNWSSPIKKFLKEKEIKAINERTGAAFGDILLFSADKEDIVNKLLSTLRLNFGKDLIKEKDFRFVWIVDFPLFEFSETEKRFVSRHHPFTMPKEDDIPLLRKDLTKVRAKAYDLVLNGVEIGGGSIRIHRSDLQKEILEILGLSKPEALEKFGFLLEAFDYGAPPHGGIAFGFDRLVMLMLGLSTIRDVIPFPKTQKGVCLLTDAPSKVDVSQLKELHIDLKL